MPPNTHPADEPDEPRVFPGPYCRCAGREPKPRCLLCLVDIIESSDAPLTDNQRWALAEHLYDCGVRAVTPHEVP